MKKIFGILSVVLLLIVTTACGSRSNAGNASTEDGEYTLRIAYLVAESQSTHIAAEEFEKTVEAESDGKINVELYPNGSLFPSDREAVEAVQLGNVEMTIPAVSALSGFNNKFMVFDLPYLFETKDAAYNALDGELGEELLTDLESEGFKGLVFAENGFRNMSNNEGAIESPEDLEGLKFRTLESPVQTATFNAFGANASPFAFGELYTALQQNTYDAMESPISLYYTNKFYEVQDYLTISGHLYAPTILLANLDWYESLPEDLQTVIDDASAEYRSNQRELAAEQDEEFLSKLKEEGMKVNELTTEQKQLFIDASQSVYEEYSDEIGQDIIEKARSANE